jgi:acylphosphatase
MNQRLHAYFIGRVQGVGFRYAVKQIAQDLRVKGWVKNLRNGNVEVVAEADEAVLKEFVKKVQESFSGYINNTQIAWDTALAEFKDFSIAFE